MSWRPRLYKDQKTIVVRLTSSTTVLMKQSRHWRLGHECMCSVVIVPPTHHPRRGYVITVTIPPQGYMYSHRHPTTPNAHLCTWQFRHPPPTLTHVQPFHHHHPHRHPYTHDHPRIDVFERLPICSRRTFSQYRHWWPFVRPTRRTPTWCSPTSVRPGDRLRSSIFPRI